MDSTSLVLAVLCALAGAAACLAALRPRLAAAIAARDAALAHADTTVARADDALARAAAADVRAATAEAEAAAARAALADRERSETALREAFDSLSARALDRSTQQLARLAEETIKRATTEARGDLDQRRQAVEHLVAPLRDSLTKVETHLREVEREREGAYRGLIAQVAEMRQTSADLRRETESLVTALRKPQVRGRWGELHLRRAVELAGMVEHCDFDEQSTTSTADGAIRPDLIVNLAGGKQIVVDAKVPLAAYLEAAEAVDEAVREARLKDHARQLRTHIDALAAKNYWERLGTTPEYVVLFVPGDAFMAAALDHDPLLYEHAAARQVLLTTPSTLIALLRTVALTWRQEALAENAKQVRDLGRELYKRLAAMGRNVESLGKALNRTVGAYNETVGSLERSVLPQARRFRDLQVTDTELPELGTVEADVRSLTSGELIESAAAVRELVALPSPAELDLDAAEGRRAASSG